MSIEVRESDPREPGATELLRASHRLMEQLFPAESNHFLTVDELGDASIRFFTAHDGDAVLGCGALSVKDGYGEVKSMFTAPEGRGRGIARQVLMRIESEARTLGLPVLRLETGDLLHDAHSLYARHGFALCDPFGDYVEDPNSIFMEKRLD